MRKINIRGLFVVATLVLSLVAATAHAQTYSDLYDFGSASGRSAQSRSIRESWRRVATATFTARRQQAEAAVLGTVFKITPQGVLSVLYNFDGTHGKVPNSGLTLATDGNFYGTTSLGGSTNLGVIFKITPAGALHGSPHLCQR